MPPSAKNWCPGSIPGCSAVQSWRKGSVFGSQPNGGGSNPLDCLCDIGVIGNVSAFQVEVRGSSPLYRTREWLWCNGEHSPSKEGRDCVRVTVTT